MKTESPNQIGGLNALALPLRSPSPGGHAGALFRPPSVSASLFAESPRISLGFSVGPPQWWDVVRGQIERRDCYGSRRPMAGDDGHQPACAGWRRGKKRNPVQEESTTPSPKNTVLFPEATHLPDHAPVGATELNIRPQPAAANLLGNRPSACGAVAMRLWPGQLLYAGQRCLILLCNGGRI